MVDWKEVERLRSKGWDWSSISENPKVGFAPPEGAGDSGRALKALYLNRKSRRSRSSRGLAVTGEEGEPSNGRALLGNRLFQVGLLGAPLAGGWGAIALYRPAPFGVLVPFFPELLAGLLLGLALVGIAFAFGVPGIRDLWKKPVVLGVVVGLVAGGLSGYIAYSEGFLLLQPSYTYSQGWQKAPNTLWTENGKPVVFFMGSAACPFCSASSWPIREALKQFGSFTGWAYATSSSGDSAGPNTPEVTLYGTSLAGTYLSWDPQESSDTQSIQSVALSPAESSYRQAYDSGGSIPYMVFGGIYMHVGTFTAPSAMCIGGQIGNPYSPPQVDSQIANQSGPVWNAILPAIKLLEAYFVKIDQLAGIQPPGAVASDPAVVSDLQSIP